jgi:hypothetical protein
MCSRREVVHGLDLVRCCHTSVTDGGQRVVCGVEMLREVFDNHWKQHRGAEPPNLEVRVNYRYVTGGGTYSTQRVFHDAT